MSISTPCASRPRPPASCSYAPLNDEIILKRYKLPLVQRFARANRIDRVAFGDAGARFGLVTAGKAFQDTMQALATLGIDPATPNSPDDFTAFVKAEIDKWGKVTKPRE